MDEAPMGTLLGPLHQIDAGTLSVGYAEAGPVGGPAVLLLHGWPYEHPQLRRRRPLLASGGYRVIVPSCAASGRQGFLSSDTPRNGQPSAVAADVVDLMDALGIDRAILAGFDWGARSANIVAALWPERCTGTVSVSGYLIGNQQAGKLPLPPRPSTSGGTSSTSPRNAAGPVTRGTSTTSRS